jgi:hypothetical protein
VWRDSSAVTNVQINSFHLREHFPSQSMIRVDFVYVLCLS